MYNPSMKSKQKRILVAIPTNGSDGRLRVAGVMRYASTCPSWDLRIISSRTSFNDNEVLNLLKEGIDGCILAAYTPAVETILKRNIPTVLALENMHEKIDSNQNCRAVLMNNQEIGRLAAEHFKSLGRFATYAFVPAPPKIPWSLERKAAFFAAADRRAKFAEYPESDFEMVNMTGESGIQTRIDELIKFLSGLHRPAAVFAANDILASQVAHACAKAQLKIPTDIALIGCDNDELLCLVGRPTITSILPGFEQAGYAAARTLNTMMRGHTPSTPVVRIPGAKLVKRASTSNLPPAVAVVNSAMEYINAHAIDGISTSDVIGHMHISRSLLDLRFRQLRNESVMDAILAVRLAAVCDKLKRTRRKIFDIGVECGFRNADYLKRLFKAKFGVSMREYRAGHTPPA